MTQHVAARNQIPGKASMKTISAQITITKISKNFCEITEQKPPMNRIIFAYNQVPRIANTMTLYSFYAMDLTMPSRFLARSSEYRMKMRGSLMTLQVKNV